MEVYIEYVLLDNMSMNWAILKFLDLTSGYKIQAKNKWLVCILGTIFAIFLPYLYFNKYLLFFYRIVVSLILVLCIKKFCGFKQFCGAYVLFILYTFLMGGVCFGLINLLGLNYTMSGVLIYDFEFPLGLLVSMVFGLLCMVYKWVKYARSKLKETNYTYKISISDGGKCVSGLGYLDTGNKVVFNCDGVSIISVNLFLKLYENIELMDVVLGRVDKDSLKGVEYINIAGIGSGSRYLSFVADSINIDGNIVERPRLAVALKNFGDFECILSGNLIKL